MCSFLVSTRFSLPFTKDPDYYHTIINTVRKSGFEPNPGFSWSNTLGIVPLAAYAFTYISLQQVVSGEIKSASKNSMFGLLGALGIAGVLMIAAVVSYLGSGTVDFVNAVSYAYYNAPSSYTLPVPPFYNTLASVMVSNAPWVMLIIGVGVTLYLFAELPLCILGISRWFLAMSFDRTLPMALSKVNDRTNTPLFAIAVSCVGAEVVLLLYTYVGGILLGLSFVFGQIIMSFILVAISGVAFPYRRKSLFDQSPHKGKIAGVPVITLAGILSVIFLGLLAYAYGAYSAYGVNSAASMATVAGVGLSGLVLFYVAKVYNKHRGLDLSLAFKEIPPE